MVGKLIGRGEDLLFDSLLMTCLKVYKNPNLLFIYILHKDLLTAMKHMKGH